MSEPSEAVPCCDGIEVINKKLEEFNAVLKGCAKVDGCARDAGWLPGMNYEQFLRDQKVRDEVARLGT